MVRDKRPVGRFTRQVLLGDGLSTEEVRADYDAGVLHVVVPVADAVRPRKVQVSTGGSSQPVDTEAEASGNGAAVPKLPQSPEQTPTGE